MKETTPTAQHRNKHVFEHLRWDARFKWNGMHATNGPRCTSQMERDASFRWDGMHASKMGRDARLERDGVQGEATFVTLSSSGYFAMV